MLWSIKITVVVQLTCFSLSRKGSEFASRTSRTPSLDSGFPAKICDPFSWTISEGASAASSALRTNLLRHMAKKRSRSVQEKTRNTSPAPDGRKKSKSIQGSRRNSRFSPQTTTTTLSTHSVKRDLKSTRVPSKGSTGNKHDGAKESTKRKHFQ